jgi:hypothetical protein
MTIRSDITFYSEFSQLMDVMIVRGICSNGEEDEGETY